MGTKLAFLLLLSHRHEPKILLGDAIQIFVASW